MPTRQIIRCTTCGRSVYQYGQSLYDPLAGQYLTGQIIAATPQDGDVKERFVYVPHECRTDAVQDYEHQVQIVISELERLREQEASPWDQADYIDAQQAASAATAQMRDLISRHSLDRACPKCQVSPGHPCENLVERKRGNQVPTKNPHEQRIPEPESIPGREIAALREQAAEAGGFFVEVQRALESERALEKLIEIAQRMAT